MTEIRSCGNHGRFEGSTCPDCDVDGVRILSGARRRRLSKFMSGVLRHFPDEYGLETDGRGWIELQQLNAVVGNRYDWADDTSVDAVVETDPKGRFEVDGERIRATYGHSIEVALEREPNDAVTASGPEPADGTNDDTAEPVPDVLCHGTAPSNVDDVLTEGIRSMSRQLVHLSETATEARSVGARHATDPVVFVVDAASMRADGRRITKRGRTVYTTEHVPPRYLLRRE